MYKKNYNTQSEQDENDGLIQRQRKYLMEKVFMNTLNNVCKQVNEMQSAVARAELVEKQMREKRVKEARKKYKQIIKSIQIKKQSKSCKVNPRQSPDRLSLKR